MGHHALSRPQTGSGRFSVDPGGNLQVWFGRFGCCRRGTLPKSKFFLEQNPASCLWCGSNRFQWVVGKAWLTALRCKVGGKGQVCWFIEFGTSSTTELAFPSCRAVSRGDSRSLLGPKSCGGPAKRLCKAAFGCQLFVSHQATAVFCGLCSPCMGN